MMTFILENTNSKESKRIGPAYMDLIRYYASINDTIKEVVRNG